MEVKHRLAAVGVGVHDDAVAPLGQLGVTRQVAREGEQATEQLWIPRIVERRELISRNAEQAGRALRIQILELHITAGPLHDRRRNLARRDLAEDAPTHAPPPRAFSDSRTPGATAPRISCRADLRQVAPSRPSPAARAKPAAPPLASWASRRALVRAGRRGHLRRAAAVPFPSRGTRLPSASPAAA